MDTLYDVLDSVHREKKTGTIHIFGKTQAGQQEYFLLSVENGIICYMGRSGRPEPVPLINVLDLKVTNVRLSSSQRKWKMDRPVPAIPAILAQLKELRKNGRSGFPLTIQTQASAKPHTNGNARSPVTPESQRLYLEAIEILQRLYGKNATDYIDKISDQASPEHEPKLFLDSCVEFALRAVGREVAQSMFQELYERLES